MSTLFPKQAAIVALSGLMLGAGCRKAEVDLTQESMPSTAQRGAGLPASSMPVSFKEIDSAVPALAVGRQVAGTYLQGHIKEQWSSVYFDQQLGRNVGVAGACRFLLDEHNVRTHREGYHAIVKQNGVFIGQVGARVEPISFIDWNAESERLATLAAQFPPVLARLKCMVEPEFAYVPQRDGGFSERLVFKVPDDLRGNFRPAQGGGFHSIIVDPDSGRLLGQSGAQFIELTLP